MLGAGAVLSRARGGSSGGCEPVAINLAPRPMKSADCWLLSEGIHSARLLVTCVLGTVPAPSLPPLADTCSTERGATCVTFSHLSWGTPSAELSRASPPALTADSHVCGWSEGWGKAVGVFGGVDIRWKGGRRLSSTVGPSLVSDVSILSATSAPPPSPLVSPSSSEDSISA